MCGRYASARRRQDLLEEFRIDRDRVADDLEPDYNVAPTKPVYAVLTRGGGPVTEERGPRPAGGSRGVAPPGQQAGREPGAGAGPPQERGGADAVARELRVVRWGLVPFWAKDPSIG